MTDTDRTCSLAISTLVSMAEAQIYPEGRGILTTCQFPYLQLASLFHAHEVEWNGECCSAMYPSTGNAGDPTLQRPSWHNGFATSINFTRLRMRRSLFYLFRVYPSSGRDVAGFNSMSSSETDRFLVRCWRPEWLAVAAKANARHLARDWYKATVLLIVRYIFPSNRGKRKMMTPSFHSVD